MEKQHQETEQIEQQSINATVESSNSNSSASPSTNSGDPRGNDPTNLDALLKRQSDNSIQAREAAKWQALADTSTQAREHASFQTPQSTGIPKNIQTIIEYTSNISLKDVRVHYNSDKATSVGKAILNEYPNLYVAPGQEEQLSSELWAIVRQLKKEQQTPPENNTNTEQSTNNNAAPSSTTTEENTTTETETTEQNTNTATEEGNNTTTEAPLPEISRQPASTSPNHISAVPVNNAAPDVQESAPLTTRNAEETTNAKPAVVKPVPSPLVTPEQDPDFKTVTDTVAKEGDKEQRHQSAEHETQEAEKAALEPSNKRESLAQSNQVDKIEQQNTPAFDTNAFISAVMTRVEAIMPKNEKEADDFNNSGKVTQVKNAVTATVSNAQNQSVGPLEHATQEQPNTSSIPSKKVTPLPRADIGRNPRDIGAEKATPKPLNEDRVEQPLQSNAQEIDNQFANNKITEEQLSKSNEPTFLAALDSKNTAQDDSEQAASSLRTEEQQGIAQTQGEAGILGNQQMSAMHQERANIMGTVHEQQQTTSSKYTAEEQVVADKINRIYTTTKTKVEGRLSRLDTRVQQMFEAGAADAQRRFERHVQQKMDAYKAERYAGIGGAFTWVGDAFTGLPDEVNAFFVEGREEYVRAMERVIRRIANHVATELTTAKQEVQVGRQEVADYVASLPDNLRNVGQKAAQDINRQFDELNSQVDAKQEELIDSLANKYKESLEKIDNRIEQLKAANRGLIDIALDAVDGVIGTILEIKAALTNVLNAALDAIHAILLDPIGFLHNLIDGVGQGLTGFMTKIHTYLTEGFVQWLTGTLSGVGLEIPEDIFSLEGIFSLTSQALGLTWDFIRERAVKILGERPVQAIEEGFEIFQIIKTDGIAGAWEHLKEQFSDLKETIMDSMMGMIISEIMEAGIQSILALLTPAGAFVKAAMMIVDVAKFFLQQGSQIFELVNAFTASISAIATGNVSKIAQSIENALAISVPVLIGFFSSLLGIGDLLGKVQTIFKKITGRITNTIDGFIEKAGAWFKDKKARRRERREQRRAERDGQNEENNPQDKAKVDKGIRLGTAIVNNENLTEEQIQVELRQLEQREGLKELDADVVNKTEQWHTFMLEAKEGKTRKTKQIRRKPTKATNEDEVTEADRQLHQRIADEVKRKLQAKGESTEGVENFEAFYGMIRDEALKLQQEYQPQLRNGIKIAVDLVNQVQKDKQDGDVDIRVKIAPNAIEKITAIEFVSDLEETISAHDKEVISIIKDTVSDTYYSKGGFTELNSEEEILNKFNSIYKEIKTTIDAFKNEPSFKGVTYKDSGQNIERIIYVYRTTNNKTPYQLGKVVVHFRDAEYRTRILKETEGVKNPVYKDSSSGQELVKDKTEEYIPRKGHRYINKDDNKNINSNSDIVSRGTQDKNELEHMTSSNNSTRLSTTVEGKKQIVGADGNTFNSNGQVDVDYAQIPREELSAVYTKQGLLAHVKGNLPARNGGKVVNERELQAFVDGVRTQEVLVGKSGIKGIIPTSAYKNQMGKAATNRARPQMLKEPAALEAKKIAWKKALRRGEKLDPDHIIDEILKNWK